MEIYLIRHTAPDIDKGICYGQADIGVKETFLAEAIIIKKHLPEKVDAIYSSPLKRCKVLADHLFKNQPIQLKDELKEINCGKWELKLWDEIPRYEIDPWMDDHVNMRIPAGESYMEVFERVGQCFNGIVAEHHLAALSGDNAEASSPNAVIVAHGGVIRSILAHVTQTPLPDSFKVFSLHYGCVVKVVYGADGFSHHEVLCNIEQEKETHKPSN